MSSAHQQSAKARFTYTPPYSENFVTGTQHHIALSCTTYACLFKRNKTCTTRDNNAQPCTDKVQKVTTSYRAHTHVLYLPKVNHAITNRVRYLQCLRELKKPIESTTVPMTSIPVSGVANACITSFFQGVLASQLKITRRRLE